MSYFNSKYVFIIEIYTSTTDNLVDKFQNDVLWKLDAFAGELLPFSRYCGSVCVYFVETV